MLVVSRRGRLSWPFFRVSGVACGSGSGKQEGASSGKRDRAGEFLAGIDRSGSVAGYSGRLDALQSKCESSGRDRIADNVAGAVKFLETKGQPAKSH